LHTRTPIAKFPLLSPVPENSETRFAVSSFPTADSGDVSNRNRSVQHGLYRETAQRDHSPKPSNADTDGDAVSENPEPSLMELEAQLPALESTGQRACRPLLHTAWPAATL